MKAEQKFWYTWMLNYSFGELLGIGAAAIVGRFLFVEFSDLSVSSSSVVMFLILLLAGSAEGLIIGYVQWKSLSKLIKHFRPLPWIVTTTVSTIAGWLLVLPPMVLFISVLSKIALLNTYYSALYTALVGIAFGGLIGIPQFFILQKFYRNAIVWIIANIVGWAVSFLIIYFTLAMFTSASSFGYILLLVVIACILSGVVQGIVTGTSLHFLMTAKKVHERKLEYGEDISPNKSSISYRRD